MQNTVIIGVSQGRERNAQGVAAVKDIGASRNVYGLDRAGNSRGGHFNRNGQHTGKVREYDIVQVRKTRRTGLILKIRRHAVGRLGLGSVIKASADDLHIIGRGRYKRAGE